MPYVLADFILESFNFQLLTKILTSAYYVAVNVPNLIFLVVKMT